MAEEVREYLGNDAIADVSQRSAMESPLPGRLSIFGNDLRCVSR